MGTCRIGGVDTAPLEGTGDARRAIDVALEGDCAEDVLPRLVSEETDPETRRSLDFDEVSEGLDIFSSNVAVREA